MALVGGCRCQQQVLLVVQIPYFNAAIFLANKTSVGKVDEIFGQINSVVSAPGGMDNAGRPGVPKVQGWQAATGCDAVARTCGPGQHTEGQSCCCITLASCWLPSVGPPATSVWHGCYVAHAMVLAAWQEPLLALHSCIHFRACRAALHDQAGRWRRGYLIQQG